MRIIATLDLIISTCKAKFYDTVRLVQVTFISSLFFIKFVGVPILSVLSPGPDYIYFSPEPDSIKPVRFRISSSLSSCPGPDFIKVVRVTGSGLDFIKF